MSTPQPGILGPVPEHARYLEFTFNHGLDPSAVLRNLAARPHDPDTVIGFGAALVQAIGGTIKALHGFPAFSAPGCEIPSTQADVWCWIGGHDRGVITLKGRALENRLRPAFIRQRLVDGFKYDHGRDLSGYEDGTENPEGEAALAAAICRDAGAGLDGSSFAAVQQWRHDLDAFAAMDGAARDHIIGRRISDNEEIDDAPLSAHVKRTAQETFDPEAFVVRRSMPWADRDGEGLMFVAFGKSLDAFEAQLARMCGREDQILDGLFAFTRPLSGSYFWCPPLAGGKLDLDALGL